MSELLVSCNDVGVSARGCKLINGVSFDLIRGESMAIIGPNGAGKSTLVKAILGFHKHIAGKITIAGRDAQRLQQTERAKLVAYVPQMLAADIPYSVREFVGMGRYVFHGSSSDEAVDHAMELANVQPFQDRIVGTLSGGERQRVCIAAALAQEAPLLVLDEPLVHLDPGQRIVIQELIRSLVPKVSVLAVTHDLDWAQRDFDSLLVLKDGRAEYTRCVNEFFTGSGVDDLFGISSIQREVAP